MVTHIGRIVTYDELISYLSIIINEHIDLRELHVRIYQIRKKIGDNTFARSLITVRGTGYILIPSDKTKSV